jgi:hypothetical protein
VFVNRDAEPRRPQPLFGVRHEEFGVATNRNAGAVGASWKAVTHAFHECIRFKIRFDFKAWSYPWCSHRVGSNISN